MGNPEDYELIPHREILDLKAQIEELKRQKGLVEQGAEAELEITNKELYDAMNRLIGGINQLIKLFKKAGDEMSRYDSNEPFIKKIAPMEKKVDELTEQNKKIARGILAVADQIKEQLNTVSEEFDAKLNNLKDSLNKPALPAQSGFGGGFDPSGFGAPSGPPAGGVPPPPIPPPQPPK